MNLNEQINKIKISLFGNVWIVRLIRLLRYFGGGLLAWLVWKSEHIFGELTFFQVFRNYVWDWRTKKVDELLAMALTLAFVLFLVFIYFWISGWLIKWLVRIDIPASQQDKIFRDKIYSANEKTNYSVEKITDLEITGFRSSSYVALKGILSLKNQAKSTKQIAFILHSHKQILQDYLIANKFKDYLPKTNIHFQEKKIFTWQNFYFLFFCLAALAFS